MWRGFQGPSKGLYITKLYPYFARFPAIPKHPNRLESFGNARYLISPPLFSGRQVPAFRGLRVRPGLSVPAVSLRFRQDQRNRQRRDLRRGEGRYQIRSRRLPWRSLLMPPLTFTGPSGRIFTLPGLRSRWRRADLARDGQSFVQGDCAFVDAVGESGPIDQFHHQIIRADIVQSADVGLIQRGDGAGFLLERSLNWSAEILMATSRPRRGSRARHTSPMPPLPGGETIS